MRFQNLQSLTKKKCDDDEELNRVKAERSIFKRLTVDQFLIKNITRLPREQKQNYVDEIGEVFLHNLRQRADPYSYSPSTNCRTRFSIVAFGLVSYAQTG